MKLPFVKDELETLSSRLQYDDININSVDKELEELLFTFDEETLNRIEKGFNSAADSSILKDVADEILKRKEQNLRCPRALVQSVGELLKRTNEFLTFGSQVESTNEKLKNIFKKTLELFEAEGIRHSKNQIIDVTANITRRIHLNKIHIKDN